MFVISVHNIRNRKYFYFDDMTIVDNFYSQNIKVNKKSYKSILIFYIRYKASNGVKPLNIIFNKINGYTEDNNGRKYPTLTTIDKNKDMLKK